MVKNPTYGGVTPEFWNSCDAIGDAASWFAWGTPNCGKGEPMQTGRTTQARRAGALPQRRGRGRLWTLTRAARSRARVLERSRADATEAIVTSDHRALTRFTHEFIHQNVDIENVAIRVRAIVDGRTGVASTNAGDDAAIDAVVQRAIEIAAFAPRAAEPPPLAARARRRARRRRPTSRRPPTRRADERAQRRGGDLRASRRPTSAGAPATSRRRPAASRSQRPPAPTRRSTAPNAAPTSR